MTNHHKHRFNTRKQKGCRFRQENSQPKLVVLVRRLEVFLTAASLCLGCLFVNVPQSRADGFSSEVVPAADNHKSNDNRHNEFDIKLSISSSTPVVTDTSGYSVKIVITNASATASGTGKLSVDTNALYTFNSRVDMQDWADGMSHIPTPNHLASADVSNIMPSESLEVTATVAPDHDQLKIMNTWGPKPVAMTYTSDEIPSSHKRLTGSTTTFLTRSSTGLASTQTPPISMSMLLPLTSTGWRMNQDRVSELMAGQVGSKSESTANSTPNSSRQKDSQSNTHQYDSNTISQQSISISQDARKSQTEQVQLLSRHPKLNTLVDPLYSGYFDNSPRVNSVMQPAVFDITTYTAQKTGRYSLAGVEPNAWNAQTASKILKTNIGNSYTNQPTYAWQGSQPWSVESLTEARKQGYTTVIAPTGLNSESETATHTGKYVVPTDAGDISILSAQHELSTLAQGNPTSAQASSETTAAGQIARFIAQSAFYQSEQPYAKRAIMVSFGCDQDASLADNLMNTIESAPWIQLQDLHALNQAEPYLQGEEARKLLEEHAQEHAADKKTTSALNDTLNSLADSRKDIQRFSAAMLAKPSQSRPSHSPSSGKSDPQALARQDAADTAQRSDDPNQWLENITRVHDNLALHALSSTDKASSLTNDARAISSQLLNGIQIKPSEAITVVSETAKMPVTISNSHPYPVAVRASSKTDSMEIVTTRTADALIPAHSEIQVTFNIRVATAGQANAEISLVDQNNIPFGQTRTTHITSDLQLSDMSGLIIVVLAFIFGALGLWRQFTRKKDPDE
jgi:hypothetical protein